MMSSPNLSHFDLLTGQKESYLGFGNPLPESSGRSSRFDALVDRAVIRVQEGFSVNLADDSVSATRLDSIISEMRDEGWKPESGNVNLFSTDFGLIVTRTLQRLAGGTLVFRSETDLNHTSIYWPTLGIETFPFHKVYKRLNAKEGESLDTFVRGVIRLVQ